MMQEAEDHSLWNDDTEEAFIKLIDLQSGGVSDLIDVASLMSIDGPLDPTDVAEARFFIPEAWRTDPDVVESAGDNIEQQRGAETPVPSLYRTTCVNLGIAGAPPDGCIEHTPASSSYVRLPACIKRW